MTGVAPHAPSPEFSLSVREVAERLNVTGDTVRRWTNQGLIPCFRTHGKHRRYRPTDVAEFADSLTAPAKTDGAA